MRVALGVAGVIVGVLLGLYLGLYVCFVGGIIDIITQIVHVVKGTDVYAWTIVWGIVKMAIAGLIGYLSALIIIIPSLMALGVKKKINVKVGR